MDLPTLDPKDYDLDFKSHNKADMIINFHRWGIPFEIQSIIYKNATKRQYDQFEFFKEVYNDPKTKKRDPRFQPFKCYLSKVLRGSSFENLTDAQIDEVVSLGTHKKPIEIARILFPEEGFEAESRGRLNKIASTIKELIDSFGLEFEGESGVYNVRQITESDYKMPESEDQLLNKIKKYVPESKFVKTNLDAYQRKCLRFLKSVLSSTRFLKTINGIKDVVSRRMFEEEFIKFVYDKPDLISEDVNGYIDLSLLFVESAIIQDRLNNLEDESREAYEGDKADAQRPTLQMDIDSAYKQKKDTQVKVNALIKTLAGSREKRLEKEQGNKTSITNLFQICSTENTRRALLNATKVIEAARQKEYEKLTEMDQTTEAEIHGISWQEIVGFRNIPSE